MNYLPIIFLHNIPKIYDQQKLDVKNVYAKYYVENSDWEWLVLEYSKLQRLFYGLVMPENTYKYFTVEELNNIQMDYGVDIELKNYLIPKEL